MNMQPTSKLACILSSKRVQRSITQFTKTWTIKLQCATKWKNHCRSSKQHHKLSLWGGFVELGILVDLHVSLPPIQYTSFTRTASIMPLLYLLQVPRVGRARARRRRAGPAPGASPARSSSTSRRRCSPSSLSSRDGRGAFIPGRGDTIRRSE